MRGRERKEEPRFWRAGCVRVPGNREGNRELCGRLRRRRGGVLEGGFDWIVEGPQNPGGEVAKGLEEAGPGEEWEPLTGSSYLEEEAGAEQVRGRRKRLKRETKREGWMKTAESAG